MRSASTDSRRLYSHGGPSSGIAISQIGFVRSTSAESKQSRSEYVNATQQQQRQQQQLQLPYENIEETSSLTQSGRSRSGRNLRPGGDGVIHLGAETSVSRSREVKDALSVNTGSLSRIVGHARADGAPESRPSKNTRSASTGSISRSRGRARAGSAPDSGERERRRVRGAEAYDTLSASKKNRGIHTQYAHMGSSSSTGSNPINNVRNTPGAGGSTGRFNSSATKSAVDDTDATTVVLSRVAAAAANAGSLETAPESQRRGATPKISALFSEPSLSMMPKLAGQRHESASNLPINPPRGMTRKSSTHRPRHGAGSVVGETFTDIAEQDDKEKSTGDIAAWAKNKNTIRRVGPRSPVHEATENDDDHRQQPRQRQRLLSGGTRSGMKNKIVEDKLPRSRNNPVEDSHEVISPWKKDRGYR